MSAAAIDPKSLPVPRVTVNPWLIAIVVALASFMEVLDTTIANVALPYIAGGMGVSEDEASWVVTSYLVSNAIILTASSFLAKMLGRKTFFLICLGIFTVSSILCGFAPNLNALLLFRILQGLGGGGMVPVAQSILADAFPPAKRGQAFAVFGIAVVVAPVVGPTLGGWLSDNLSWHWCFLINAPVGAFAIALIAAVLQEPARPKDQKQDNSFDFIGFALVATFLGALEVTLDRGLEDDWFGSSFIIASAAICAIAFVLMIPWEMTRRNPMIDLRMVATRQFGASFLVMLATGAILLATTQFLPQLVQQDFGYTATWAGLVLSPGGVVTMVMMFAVGRLAARVQPKYLIIAGALVIAASMYSMTNVYGDLGFWYMARSRMLIGVGLPLIFIPIMAASYDGIPAGKTDQASALINAARNTGGSIGVSLVSNVLTHREQFHQSRLVEQVTPSSPQYQDTMHRMTDFFIAQGSSLLQAQQQAVQWIGQQVQTQASFLSYMDAFWVLMLIALSAIPLALTLRNIKLGGPAPAGH
ncbi:DHA2 family efflux MFS transporter permease subunit [Bradyrhizobium viridifuturi]|jgi:DHA2 family multidrug resistance protein|uniref:DHA2 family efflux MFS transporter permease subunit n=2 Tax=Nitrobacteraceae TaxID=41294 RepID=UPI0003965344|nr:MULTISPECIES: DHA2 family efflux MFS transporter permease subunit [Bradyrhizobium]ERF83649.1 MAG: drug:H+ antiporter-2(DHA2) family drug resistance MFS transporter [Bradyrhizobium sp. DFCI-1]OYU58572.1 MAG: MFS transporter [Bradyrhizobium sp. PARBB1]PSO16802.1 MFS transporter [Bradyrhizobium sp. MOS004]QRI70412.1 DHA2 family efflux MFS transporter permease subunit [Bradyrhizobium sp. PSBB068]MBR1022538.1 DHA2 family efflux MFS transporter permease subunit [Bradyrhizobium viridifuturi]